MEIKKIGSLEEVNTFLGERGLQPESYDAFLFKIDKTHFLRLKLLPKVDAKTASEMRKNFGSEMHLSYQLLINKNFDTFIFIRGYGRPPRVVFNKKKRYPKDTKKSLLKKFNGLKYEDSDHNSTFDALFSVREVVDKFYREYRGVREKLAVIIGEKDGDMYAQVLLDRVIFIYFLQAKKIIPNNYLTKLFYEKEDSENYYRDYLFPLFFELFNKEEELREREIEQRFPGIPYLNGGLFSPREGIETNGIEISNEMWKEIFELLNRYEWVVEEDKNDSTAITPSILGHIYEKSVNQKETGSFYTPEEITQYISKNTIVPYLTGKVNEKFKTAYKEINSELLDKNNHTKEEIDQVGYLYFNWLKKITICDPACGSGAFLIAAEYLLFELYKKCVQILLFKPFFKKERERLGDCPEYVMKRDIITNNLYGVDIQEGSVEIAKLRLWLSMISEMSEKASEIEPLPNIDYNLMSGNSLIGYTQFPKKKQTTITDFDSKHKSKLDELKEMRKEYRTTKSSKRSEEIRAYLQREIKPLRKEMNELFCKELALSTTETLTPSKNLSEEENKKTLLRRLKAINMKSVLTKFKIKCNQPNSFKAEEIKAHKGVTCYVNRKSKVVTSVSNTAAFSWVKYNRGGELSRLIETLVPEWKKVSGIEVTKKLAPEDLEELKPFHWCLEFYEVFT